MQYQRQSVQLDRLSLAYARIGAGRPVVYIHGALTTLEEGLVGLAETLAPNFEITAFDRPGHGESGRDAGSGSTWRQAELIHAAMGRLGLERPVVVGHSFGGAVAMALALQYPDSVSGAVLLAPIAFPEPRLEIALFGSRALPVTGDWLSLLAAPTDALLLPALWDGMFLPQRMTPAFRDGFPFDLASGRSQLQADGQDALAMVRSLGRSAALYASCQTRVRVIQGDQDLVVNPLVHGRPLAALLPRGAFTSLPGLGHMAHHFAPEAVSAAIDDLFEHAGDRPAPRP